MGAFDWIGIGIALVFGCLGYAVRAMPQPVAWGGIAFGLMLLAWPHLPFSPRFNGPGLLGCAIFILAVVASTWTLALRREMSVGAAVTLPRAAPVLPHAVADVRDVPADAAELIERLRPLARPITISCPNNDIDAFKYATKWFLLFKKAGWDTGANVQRKDFTQYLQPLVIGVATGLGRSESGGIMPGSEPRNLRELYNVLHGENINVPVSLDATLADQQQIEFVVGDKF